MARFPRVPRRLQSFTEQHGLAISDDGWSRLERLIGLWQQYGRAINVVGTTERDALIEHVQEGLQCVACAEALTAVDGSCHWVDVGSGGGLPGLVVAAVRPCSVTLVEPRKRRAAFLDLGLSAVGVGPGRVVRARWSEATWQQLHRSDAGETTHVLSSRAVFSPDRWMHEASTVSVSRGVVLCHVDASIDRVAGRRPAAAIRGPRWGVLGFRIEG